MLFAADGDYSKWARANDAAKGGKTLYNAAGLKQSVFMEQVFEFAGNHPMLVGGFVVILAALLITEFGRLRRGFREVGALEAVNLINRDGAVVLDVSSSAEYNKAHIINARHMPVSQLEASNTELTKLVDKPVVVYCKNGVSASQAAGKLGQLGLTRVFVLRGGLGQWLADKQPVTKGK